MIKKISILFFLVLFSGYSKAQTIHKIELDSLSQITSFENKMVGESLKSQKMEQKNYTIWHLNLKDKKTYASTKFFLFPNDWYAFYYKNELVFAFHEYMENSRMGSCGEVDIFDYYFIKDKQFTHVFHFEEPFECYNLHPVSTVEQLLQLLK